ncbi:UNVERIFIED_CONTAM: hypothetical protein Sradi_4625200 [Sesamum radiatum]|uniref:Uncharacterized protein n=1 Tax=Sesamum radiatum TaxID=300843 RepID=A0AAW2NBG9_SESRA
MHPVQRFVIHKGKVFRRLHGCRWLLFCAATRIRWLRTECLRGLRRRLPDVLSVHRCRNRQPPRGVSEIQASRPPLNAIAATSWARAAISGWESPQPDSRFLVGLPHLADPLAGVPPPHPPVHRVPRLPELFPAGPLFRIIGS